MSLPLALVLPNTPPTLVNHLDDLLLLVVCLAFFIFALIVLEVLVQGLRKAFAASADWIERKSARRRRRRAVLRKHYPPLRVVRPCAEPVETSLLANDALRRSAEAAHQAAQSTSRPKSTLRAVKPRGRG